MKFKLMIDNDKTIIEYGDTKQEVTKDCVQLQVPNLNFIECDYLNKKPLYEVVSDDNSIKILGVDFSVNNLCTFVGVKSKDAKRNVIYSESKSNLTYKEITKKIKEESYKYDYVCMMGIGFDKVVLDDIPNIIKHKFILPEKYDLNTVHRLIMGIKEFKLNKQLGLDIPLKVKMGYAEWDFKNIHPIHSSVLKALALANYGFNNMPKQLEFNECNIRKIVEESFNNELWDMCYEDYKGDYLKGRKEVNKENFIDHVVYSIMNNEVVHLAHDEWHRGISKTYLLQRLSQEFKIPVVYKFESQKNIFERDCYKAYTIKEVLMEGSNFKNGNILIDEGGVNFKDIYKLRNLGIGVSGFMSTYGRYSRI